jgi:outer membrane protein assembly factor BamA
VGEPTVEPEGPGLARLIVPVEEARANTFDGAIGYQGESKTLTGLADVRLENLGGRARQAGLFWEGRGSGRSEFRVRYLEPLLFGQNWRGEVLLSQFNEDTLYTRTRLAGRFTFGVGGGGEREKARKAGKTRKSSVIPFRRLLLPYMDLQSDNGARSFRPK